jgi:Uma2 family endonuclease
VQTTIDDLDIPEVKPALELYRGVLRQKKSPQFTHADIQSRMGTILRRWAAGRGRVGSEWRFYFLESDGIPSSSLVPDVSFVSFERLPYDAVADAERPTIAPDIAVEVLSPDERPGRVAEKTGLYRHYGTRVVVVIDPRERSVRVHALAREPVMYSVTGLAPVLDDFAIDLGELFAPLEPPRP